MSNNITSDFINVTRERVNRAWEHIEDFKRESADFLELAPYESIFDIQLEGKEYVKSFRIKIKQFAPVRLRLIAGDVFHNLDAVLDNISYALAGRKFPVFNSPEAFNKKAEPWLANISADVADLIRGLQPYNSRNTAEHPIRILRSFSGSDKHELPVLLAGIVPAFAWSGWGELQGIRLKRRHRAIGLEDGTEIAAWASTDLDKIQNFHPRFSFHIAFGKNTPNLANILLVQLHNFIRDEVIAKFEALFFK